MDEKLKTALQKMQYERRESNYPQEDDDFYDEELDFFCPACNRQWQNNEYVLQECTDCGYPEVWEHECNCSDPGCPCGGHKIGGL